MNEHSGRVPRDFWLEEWEKQAIVGFHLIVLDRVGGLHHRYTWRRAA